MTILKILKLLVIVLQI